MKVTLFFLLLPLHFCVNGQYLAANTAWVDQVHQPEDPENTSHIHDQLIAAAWSGPSPTLWEPFYWAYKRARWLHRRNSPDQFSAWKTVVETYGQLHSGKAFLYISESDHLKVAEAHFRIGEYTQANWHFAIGNTDSIDMTDRYRYLYGANSIQVHLYGQALELLHSVQWPGFIESGWAESLLKAEYGLQERHTANLQERDTLYLSVHLQHVLEDSIWSWCFVPDTNGVQVIQYDLRTNIRADRDIDSVFAITTDQFSQISEIEGRARSLPLCQQGLICSFSGRFYLETPEGYLGVNYLNDNLRVLKDDLIDLLESSR